MVPDKKSIWACILKIFAVEVKICKIFAEKLADLYGFYIELYGENCEKFFGLKWLFIAKIATFD